MEVVALAGDNTPEVLRNVLQVLKSGGTAVIPTDTVYGLAADALHSEAVRRVFAIKTRQGKNPLPVFVASLEKAEELARIENGKVREFLEKVWPGKVSCVLKARKEVPQAIKAADGTIALRIPNHDFALNLLRAFGRPLTGTSANISGIPPHTKIQELIEEFEKAELKPDLIIDAGDLPESLPSTVVDLTSWPPHLRQGYGGQAKILREGAVSKEELKAILSSFGNY